MRELNHLVKALAASTSIPNLRGVLRIDIAIENGFIAAADIHRAATCEATGEVAVIVQTWLNGSGVH